MKGDINYLWGGRFNKGPSDMMKEINNSINIDRILYRQDISVSISHAKMLYSKGILKAWEADKIIEGLNTVLWKIESGENAISLELEDIHSNIEFLLGKEIGDLAGKLHTARSRNDQVATVFRMWTRENLYDINKSISCLQRVFLDLADKNIDCMIPGFTHLQIAQPVLFSHHVIAYIDMFARDRERLDDCAKRLNMCPLGCAALAGTSFDVDRDFVAKDLGFIAPTRNSIDTIADRDFAIEFLSCLSICAMHLSRWAEELILWCSEGFNFITIDEGFTSGSSIMPQKRNPDAAELIRAKSAHIFSSLNSLLVIMKGLPLTYNKDMQEDKKIVFEAVAELNLCLGVAGAMSAGIELNYDKTAKLAGSGYSTATDLADWLVKHLDIPFRQSHHVVGELVKLAESLGVASLAELQLSRMQTVEPKINEDVFKCLGVRNSIDSKLSYGGTAKRNVVSRIAELKKQLK